MSIKTKSNITLNPKSNIIIGYCLRSFNLDNSDLDSNQPIEEFLLEVAVCSTFNLHHFGLPTTQLLIGRDMMMLVNFEVDQESIKEN